MDMKLMRCRPTVVGNESPPTGDRRMSVVSQIAPSIQHVDVGRHSSFWQRDLHYLLNSVISDHPREYGRH